MERCQLFNNVLTHTHVQASVCIFKHGGFSLKGTGLSLYPSHTHTHTRVLLKGCLCVVSVCECVLSGCVCACVCSAVFCDANMLTVVCFLIGSC